MKKILVTGAVGQIGSDLTVELRRRYGPDNVVAAGQGGFSAVMGSKQNQPFVVALSQALDVQVLHTLDMIARFLVTI